MDFSKLVLDHVAIAVKDLEQAVKRYEILGLKFSTEREVVASQGVKTAFAPIDQHAHLELLMPFGESGPIHQYLQKKGEGIHHLCFRVDDIESKSRELTAQGMVLLYEKAQTGAHDCLVNFIHPKSTGGVLIEISQPNGKK
jgi:methylmalonyl-CoA/ethylmalonyl-CoA epimerase